MQDRTKQDLSALPEHITRPTAWLGSDMRANTQHWLYELSEAEVADLEAAANHFLRLDRDIGQIAQETFPLETFCDHLDHLRHTLLHGVGVEVLRGLPIHRYSQQLTAAIFCGIGAHLGSARSQNAAGHILGHVRDIGADAEDPDSRIYQTHERQTFHTDSADVVGLLCLNKAQEGGQSLLVSAESIYNRMRAQRPDLLELLFDPIATDRRGEVPEGAKPFVEIPVFSWFAGLLTVFYQRQYIDSAQRFQGTMPLSRQHVAALDLFDELANDPELCVEMQLEPGDMQFVYNHAMLHDRTAFIDWPEQARRRHLMRLWLSIDGDRPLPPCFEERYGSIKIGNRGGIVTESTVLHAPLD